MIDEGSSSKGAANDAGSSSAGSGLDIGAMLGADWGQVEQQLKEANVSVANVVDRQVPGPVALMFRMRAAETVRAGDHVDVITSNNRVVGINVNYAKAFSDLQDRVAALEQQSEGKG
jgi:hypothetical protein